MHRNGQTATGCVRLRQCGDTALTVEFGSEIDERSNARVLALDAALAADPPAGLLETVPTYRSLLVVIDPVMADLPALGARLVELAEAAVPTRANSRTWLVPVVYGGDFGMDLETLARSHGLTAEGLVARHSGTSYRIAMIGFMPGFAYLSGLDPELATPRRMQPRLKTPAQSVSIGGAQTAISTVEGPSGWHMIGRTPARGFMPRREPIFLYAPGDEIRFERIGPEEWPGLDARAAAGEPIARLIG
jgi:KipI family sensor histidine kinase inhibitor